MELAKEKEKHLKWILMFAVVLLNMKRILADYTIDVEYAIAMSYRLAMGDQLFTQMWEPHQTSAFVLAFFIKLWLMLTGGTAGIVVYLSIISLIFKLGGGIIFSVLHNKKVL